MWIFRNRSFKVIFILQVFLSILAISLCMVFKAKVIIILCSLIISLLLLEIIENFIRYTKINALSCSLNEVLNKNDDVDFRQFCEGELSILSSEIQKLINALYMQSEILTEDKQYLSNSIADISHQIRTPLTSINLILEMISSPNISEKEKSDYILELRKLLNRIDWLISTLLKISKLDTGTASFSRGKVSVSKLIDNAYAMVAIPMELKNQALKLDIGDETFIGDINWSSEAISNILKNCMEHTPEGGEISIHSKETALFTEIVIMDNGMGIKEDEIPHIFERFYKGSGSDSSGFGIGLALAKMIIVNQNGKINVSNRKRNNSEIIGAMFTISFYKNLRER